MPVNEGITKKTILNTLLRDKSVDEPTLRREVKKELDLKDDSSIRVHLNDLFEKNCITKIIPPPKKGNKKSGLSNKWEIKFNNLRYIVDAFPDIDLKSNKNIVEMVCSQICKGHCFFSTDKDTGIIHINSEIENNIADYEDGFYFEIYLRREVADFIQQSQSFFYEIITNDFSELQKKYYQLFKLDCIIKRSELTDVICFKWIFENIFLHHIRNDIIKGVATANEIDYYTNPLRLLAPICEETIDEAMYFGTEINKIKNEIIKNTPSIGQHIHFKYHELPEDELKWREWKD